VADGAMGGGSPGPEVGGGGGAEGAAQGIGASTERSIDSASPSLAGTIESLEESQGVGTTFAELADGSIGGEPQPDGSDEPSLEITPEDLVANPSLEIKPEDLKPTIEITPGDLAADPSIEIKSEDLQPAEAPEGAPTDEAISQVEVLTAKIDTLEARADQLTQQMSEVQSERDAVRRELTQSISEIPGLVDTLTSLLEKATPEQKKPISIFLRMLQALMKLLASSVTGEGGARSNEKKKEVQPAPPVRPAPSPIQPQRTTQPI